MADNKKLVFFGAHTGNTVNGIAPVAQLFKKLGHTVAVYLQPGQSASESYCSEGKVYEVLDGLSVHDLAFFSSNCLVQDMSDAVICAMSPVNDQNIEISGLHCARAVNIPAFGVSDFPGSWRNYGWRGEAQNLTTLFSPMPEPNAPCQCVVSGWGALEKWRNKDIGQMAIKSRCKLGIGSEPVLYVSFSPEQESPLALGYLALLIRRALIRSICVVVNRHGREKTTPIAGNARRYQWALELLAESNVIIDHSPEFGDLSPENDYSVADRFRPKEFLSYQEALALTSENGLMLSFFGTDALIAPFLASQGILSVCWLDPVLGGAVLKREKWVESFDLPAIWQPTDDEWLIDCLKTGLGDNLSRVEHLTLLEHYYPFPEKLASQIIVDEILRQLG